ncbi:hypothetical protein CCACVL1_29837, partial [Corchorus capsularis]
ASPSPSKPTLVSKTKKSLDFGSTKDKGAVEIAADGNIPSPTYSPETVDSNSNAIVPTLSTSLEHGDIILNDQAAATISSAVNDILSNPEKIENLMNSLDLVNSITPNLGFASPSPALASSNPSSNVNTPRKICVPVTYGRKSPSTSNNHVALDISLPRSVEHIPTSLAEKNLTGQVFKAATSETLKSSGPKIAPTPSSNVSPPPLLVDESHVTASECDSLKILIETALPSSPNINGSEDLICSTQEAYMEAYKTLHTFLSGGALLAFTERDMNPIYEAACIRASNPRLSTEEEEFWHHFPKLFKTLAADRQACPSPKEIRLKSRLTESKNLVANKMAEIAVMEAEITDLANKRREIAKGQIAILKERVKNTIPFFLVLRKIDQERESLKLVYVPKLCVLLMPRIIKVSEQSAAPFDSFTELINPKFVVNDKLLVFEEDRALAAAKSADEVYRSLDPKANAATATLPPPQSFIRARYGSGEILPVPLQFEHPARTQSPWTTWTGEVLRDTAFSNLLKKAGVIPSIVLSRHAYYTKDNMAVEHLVRRWNKDTHTFIFAFGEVGVTLEDVINFTLLPIHGDNDLDTLRAFTFEEKNRHDTLVSIIAHTDTQMGPLLKEWCRHFVTRSGRNSPMRREAFVLAWLTIIFGAYPEKRIMR